jgi:hypothetical protein
MVSLKMVNILFSNLLILLKFFFLILDSNNSLGSRLKDMALGFTIKAAEKAKEVSKYIFYKSN